MLINNWAEIEGRFHAMNHTAKSSNNLNEWGIVLASAYKLAPGRACDMWMNLINENKAVDSNNAKYFVTQIFNQVMKHLSPDEAAEYILRIPRGLETLFEYGYVGAQEQPCAACVFCYYIKRKQRALAFEILRLANLKYTKGEAVAFYNNENIGHYIFSAITCAVKQDREIDINSFLDFLDECIHRYHGTLLSAVSVVLQLQLKHAEEISINDNDMALRVLSKKGKAFADLFLSHLYSVRNHYSNEKIVSLLDIFCRRVPHIPVEYSNASLSEERAQALWYQSILRSSKGLLHIYFSASSGTMTSFEQDYLDVLAQNSNWRFFVQLLVHPLRAGNSGRANSIFDYLSAAVDACLEENRTVYRENNAGRSYYLVYGRMTDAEKKDFALALTQLQAMTPQSKITRKLQKCIERFTKQLWGFPQLPLHRLWTEFDEWDLSIKSLNCLKRAGIFTVEDLVANSFETLAGIENMTEKTLEEILEAVAINGLSIAPSDSEEPYDKWLPQYPVELLYRVFQKDDAWNQTLFVFAANHLCERYQDPDENDVEYIYLDTKKAVSSFVKGKFDEVLACIETELGSITNRIENVFGGAEENSEAKEIFDICEGIFSAYNNLQTLKLEFENAEGPDSISDQLLASCAEIVAGVLENFNVFFEKLHKAQITMMQCEAGVIPIEEVVIDLSITFSIDETVMDKFKLFMAMMGLSASLEALGQFSDEANEEENSDDGATKLQIDSSINELALAPRTLIELHKNNLHTVANLSEITPDGLHAIGIAIDEITNIQAYLNESGFSLREQCLSCERLVEIITAFAIGNSFHGRWIVDTSLTLATLDSLCSGLDYRDIMDKFIEWATKASYTATGRVFGMGNTLAKAFRAYQNGKSLCECGGTDERDNGNGSLMRIIPIALFCHLKLKDNFDLQEKMYIIHNASALTHAHNRSKIACGILSFVLWELIDVPFRSSIYVALKKAKNFYELSEFADELKQFSDIFEVDFSEVESDELDSSPYVIGSLKSVLWCVMNSNCPSDAIKIASQLGGDVDTNAALAAALSATIYGLDILSMHKVNELKNYPLIQRICHQFYHATNNQIWQINLHEPTEMISYFPTDSELHADTEKWLKGYCKTLGIPQSTNPI